jgi:glycosyltransferase involved in cell wall biosynthesis
VYVKGPADLLGRLKGQRSAVCLQARRYLDFRALADFARHLARVQPAVVVAANGYALLYAWAALCLVRLRVPLVVTFHSTRLPGLKERLQMAAYRPLFWSAACTVFVCEAQMRYWRRRALGSLRNAVIYNGVDTGEFCDRGDGGRRAQLGFAETDYVIGVCALLRPEKNHLQLLQALAALRDLGLPAKALLIGDGEMRGAIEARARELGVQRELVITGLQRDVRSYVEACDAMVLCSHAEAFSMAAIEAMALRRPVVHAAVGGAAEMILPGRTGFLYPAGDTRALVDKLALLAERALCRRMGNRARGVVELLFSERAMVDRYERLLAALCAGRSGTVHLEHGGHEKLAP